MNEVEVFREDGLWVAFDDDTLSTGFGDTEEEARADLLDCQHDAYQRLSELGPERVAQRLWATMPTLRKALGIAEP